MLVPPFPTQPWGRVNSHLCVGKCYGCAIFWFLFCCVCWFLVFGKIGTCIVYKLLCLSPCGTKSKKMSKLFKVCLKLQTTADLLIQQAKVRRNSFITIKGHFYHQNFNYVLCTIIITRLAPIEWYTNGNLCVFWG